MKAAHVAYGILDELGITGPEDLQQLDLIAWQRGAIVRETRLQGAEARLTALGRHAVITVSTAVLDLRRRRFGTAHELGHWEMHRQATAMTLCTTDDIQEAIHQRKSDHEREANEFAAHLLLPDRFLTPLCEARDPSLNLIAQLADRFNVSLTATALRYAAISAEPCAVVLSRQGFIQWFRASRSFEGLGLFLPVGDELMSATLADQLFRGRSVPARGRRVQASAWLTEGSFPPDATIVEQSLAMPTYDSVLTLLWVDDDLQDDTDPE